MATFTLRCCAENGEAGSQGVAAAAHSLQDSLDHSTDAANSNQETSERRARVKDLFYAMDKDGNGKLDVGEFRGKTYCEQLYVNSFFAITPLCPKSELLYAVDIVTIVAASLFWLPVQIVLPETSQSTGA